VRTRIPRASSCKSLPASAYKVNDIVFVRRGSNIAAVPLKFVSTWDGPFRVAVPASGLNIPTAVVIHNGRVDEQAYRIVHADNVFKARVRLIDAASLPSVVPARIAAPISVARHIIRDTHQPAAPAHDRDATAAESPPVAIARAPRGHAHDRRSCRSGGPRHSIGSIYVRWCGHRGSALTRAARTTGATPAGGDIAAAQGYPTPLIGPMPVQHPKDLSFGGKDVRLC